MAVRARLVAPPPPRQRQQWHSVKWKSVDISTIAAGERRMEADTYLSAGFSLRESIKSHKAGTAVLRDVALVRQPDRLKGILVDRAHGMPFLAATQVFDVRPLPRKFLAKDREILRDYSVADGTILVTRSGSVGRSILSYAPHRDTVISDDLLRVTARESKYSGWLYAFLLSRQVRDMAVGVQYGHIIKHLEVSHLEKLPIPAVSDDVASDFSARALHLLELRNRAHDLGTRADELFARALGTVKPKENETGFVVDSSALSGKRRRLEANYYTPIAAAVLKRMRKSERLGDLCERVWWMARFKRFYGEAGIPYLSANELFTVNSEPNRILVDPSDHHQDYFVKRGWIVMACSGQVYGLNGAAALMTAEREKVFFSHDLIRIIPNKKKVPPGYLLVALTHPTHGRPLLIRAAYGTSIPHLDPGDVADFPVARLDEDIENEIGTLAEEAAKARAAADVLEQSIAIDAGKIVQAFAGR